MARVLTVTPHGYCDWDISEMHNTSTTLLMIATLFSVGLAMTTDHPVVWVAIAMVFAVVQTVLTLIELSKKE